MSDSVEFTNIGAAALHDGAGAEGGVAAATPRHPAASAGNVELVVSDAGGAGCSYATMEGILMALEENSSAATATDERSPISAPAQKKKRGCLCCLQKGYRFHGAEAEEARVLRVVALGYNGEDGHPVPEHKLIVETIYFLLTGDHWKSEAKARMEEKCQAPDDLSDIRASAWEDVGFQGRDPGTDLRAAGMLSMLQMLWLCERKPRFTEAFFQLSRHERLGFPLMLVGINATLVCVQALKAGKLFDLCNVYESVLDGLNELYFGIMRHIRSIWEERQLTVMDFQAVLDEVRTLTNERPRSLTGTRPNDEDGT